MTEYDKCCLCYEALDFKQCAEILHKIIDTRTFQGVHLPEIWKLDIQELVSEVHLSGAASPSLEEFQSFSHRIEKWFLEGGGNPTVNN